MLLTDLFLTLCLLPSEWKCPTCSSAYETLRQPSFMMGLFTLFAMLITGWSVLRRARV